MEKSLVMRWVVPPTVSTPATATASHSSATSALWRRTKRVRAGIGASRFIRPAGLPPAIASVPPARVLRRPAEVASSRRAYSPGSTRPGGWPAGRNGLTLRGMDTAQQTRARPAPPARALPPWRGWPSVRDTAIAAALTVIAVAAAHADRRAAARGRGGRGAGLAASLPPRRARLLHRGRRGLHPARLRQRRGAAAARRGDGDPRRDPADPPLRGVGGGGHRDPHGRHRPE